MFDKTEYADQAAELAAKLTVEDGLVSGDASLFASRLPTGMDMETFQSAVAALPGIQQLAEGGVAIAAREYMDRTGEMQVSGSFSITPATNIEVNVRRDGDTPVLESCMVHGYPDAKEVRTYLLDNVLAAKDAVS